MNDLLTTKQVAKMLSVNHETVRRWITTGQLKGYKIGSLRNSPYRIKQDDLALFASGLGAGGEQRETHKENLSDSSAQAAPPAPKSNSQHKGDQTERRWRWQLQARR